MCSREKISTSPWQTIDLNNKNHFIQQRTALEYGLSYFLVNPNPPFFFLGTPKKKSPIFTENYG